MKSAFALADSMVAWHKAAAQNPEAAVAGSNQMSMNNALGTEMNRAQEQYDCFRGHSYTAIRPKAQAVACQRVCLARASRATPGSSIRSIPMSKVPRSMHHVKGLDTVLSEVEHHPFLDSINVPNDIMVSWSLMYITICSLELTGRSYWWFWKDKKNADRYQIWPIPTSWLFPKHSDTKLYSSYTFREPGSFKDWTIPGNEIIPFFYPDPGNPKGALSPLQASSAAVAADNAIMKAQVSAFRNGLNPGLAVIVGDVKDPNNEKARGRLTRTQRNQIINALKVGYRGVLHNGEPIVLDAVVRDIKHLTNKPNEMDFQESSKLVQSRIMEAHGTSKFVVGASENGNRAQAVAAEHHFNEFTVNPLIEYLSQVMTARIGPKFASKGETLVVYIEPRETDDPDTKRNDMKFLSSQGALTINEMRRSYGLVEIKGGDVRPMTNNIVYRKPDDEGLDTQALLGGSGAGGSVDRVAEGQQPHDDEHGIGAERDAA